jgi:alanine racemase
MAKVNFPQPPSVPLALVIDLEAVSHNYRTLCARLKKGAFCAAVLKANAYGMGVKEVSSHLYQIGCRHFFLAHLTEAIELQCFVGQDASIYVLNGLRQGDEAVYARYNLIPVLSDPAQVQIWNAFSKKKQKCLKAALHFDTGMTRTGIPSQHIKSLDLANLSHTEIVCVMSHLACAYQASHPMNETQRLLFESIQSRFPFALASLSGSGGFFIAPKYHYDLIRAGLALTGCRSTMAGRDYALKPALKAYAQILQINEIARGESIGYDATFTALQPSRIATVGVGYADGYLRSLSNRGEVYFDGHSLPVVGRISMDLFTIDVTDVPSTQIHAGDWVELFGDNIHADKLAEKAGTVSWELFTRMGARFERFYLNAEKTKGVA